jgi:hypothetical protein
MRLEEYYGGTWITKSRCWNEKVDPDMFDEANDRSHEAAAFCALCPVQKECIALGNSMGEHLIWGGKTYSSRRKTLVQSERALQAMQERLNLLQQGNTGPTAA